MIILLNGCLNAGKTTVAKAIVSQTTGLAHIEVDDLRNFISWMPLEESIELNLQNAVAVAKNFHARGISSIITYPLSSGDLVFIKKLLGDATIPLHAITLYPGLDKLKTNRGTRELTNVEVNRIDELYAMGVVTPDFGITIDNSMQTVEETAADVLKLAGYIT